MGGGRGRQVHMRPQTTTHLHQHVSGLEEVDELLHAGGAAGEGVTQSCLHCSDVGAGREDKHGGELGWVTGHALELVRVHQLVKLKRASDCNQFLDLIVPSTSQGHPRVNKHYLKSHT